MPLGKGRRKLLLGLGIFLLISVALWFAFPWWLPWALRPLAGRVGARFSSYERVGYTRFRLQNLILTNESLIVHAGRVEAFVPTVWLWKLAVERDSTPSPFVVLNDWTCQLLPSNKPSSPPGSQLQAAAATLRTVQHWLPTAQLSNGTIQSGDTKVTLPNAAWHEGALDATVTLPPAASGQTLTVALRRGRPFELYLACPRLSLNSTLVISTNETGFDLNSTSSWQSSRVEMQAHFGGADTLPETAVLQATNLVIPAALARLPHYDSIAGSVAAQWQDGRFELNVSAAVRPVGDETNWPPGELSLQVRGNTNSATLEKFVVSTAFLQTSLSTPVDVTFSPPFVRSPAALTLEANLNRQHWVNLGGQITGTVQLAQGMGKFPTANLRITGSDVGNASLQASSVQVSAKVDWPLAQLVTADAHFKDGSGARLSGQIDLVEKSVTNGTVQLIGPFARRWLPLGYSFGDLAVAGTFQGPIDKLSHAGRLQASQITGPRFYPLNLNLQWSGQNKSLDHFSLQLSNTNANLAFEGGLDLGTNQVQLELRQLQLQTNGVSALELTQPLTISYAPRGPASAWSLRTTRLHAAGPAGDLNIQAAVQWPTQGAVEFGLERFPTRFFEAFSETELPQVDIARLKASAAWSNGPAHLTLSLSAKGTPAGPTLLQAQKGTQASDRALALPAQLLSTPLQLELNLAGDAHGLVLSNLLVSGPTSAVVSAHGFLPVTINPVAATDLIEIQVDQPMQLKASIRRQAYFWRGISELAGVRLEDPTVDLDLSGNWRQPLGTLMVGIRSIRLNEETLTNLALSDLRLALKVDRQAARLTEGQVLVQGQKVSLTGELPLDESSWAKLAHKQPPSLEKANAQLRIEKAKLAAFEPLFPEVVAPQGELDADLSLRPGGDLEGSMMLRNARTRPLGNTAPLRNIDVTLRFHNRVLALENASANLSGARIELTGRADLRGTNWMAAGLPPFSLTLRGTNVPLAREPEYIIRSDLDLAIIKTNEAPPLVCGNAHLRDSFYLSDLSALVPGGVSAPASRPPFFSIDNPSVADWRLGVAVDGVRWLKLRTSLFNGEVSANLHLEGTLKDPIALGVLKVDSGVVRFPFANLQVQQGLVTLTSQDPYRPQLMVRAASKQFGYDIRLEVTGSVDSPIIQFTSNPSLSSEQILLMITAGQLPQGNYSLTPQQRAQTVALFLGRDVLSKLGFGDTSQDRLNISSGEEISVQNRPTYHVEYKLTPRWSITGEYDRFGDFNAGFKWRVYSK